ncbi:MAG: hypothetical protein HY815_00520, partial [Candidatus Riflebacteria bacterium]|nr:hypothetical protein [Candidatus Riflebacteria bacterium]
LGMKAPEPVVVVKAEPCDPLEPYRRPRLLDHDRCEKVPPPPPPPPTEVVVLILARTVR